MGKFVFAALPGHSTIPLIYVNVRIRDPHRGNNGWEDKRG